MEHSDQIVFKGKRVDMALRKVRTSTGEEIVREVVIHHGAVIILPVLPDGSIVLIENLRHTVGEKLWELPAGTLEKGEDPADCARRELEEETGYRSKKITAFGWFYTSPGILTEKMYAFVADGLEPGPQELEDTENITVTPKSREQILKMIRENQIVDGKTIAVLLKYLVKP